MVSLMVVSCVVVSLMVVSLVVISFLVGSLVVVLVEDNSYPGHSYKTKK